jgi:hypothetical protein
MNIVELLIGLAEISIALAGFTGVVVAFGSRSEGSWHPGDRLRLVFLLAHAAIDDPQRGWALMSGLWALYMTWSLWASHTRIQDNSDAHGDIDKIANRLIGTLFGALVVVQVVNAAWWQAFPPFLAAVMLNLAGAAMQFARLIRSAFHE